MCAGCQTGFVQSIDAMLVVVGLAAGVAAKVRRVAKGRLRPARMMCVGVPMAAPAPCAAEPARVMAAERELALSG